MTDAKKLTADDARALLSDHIEGSLDGPTRAEVDALLGSDPALALEHRRLAQTMQILKTLAPPEAPTDTVAKVRGRLAAERRGERLGGSGLEDTRASVRSNPGWRRWGGVEAAIGLAAAASIAIFVAVVGGNGIGGGGADTHAAGIGGDVAAVSTTLVAPDVPLYVLTELAAKAGMSWVGGSTFEGDRRAAARFVLTLKEVAARRGVEIAGFVPDAERVRIEVK